jgi:uncharacterized protein (DUF2147 family)
MRLATTMLAVGLVTLAMAPGSAKANAIDGNWKTADGKSVIQFYPCGAGMCGKIARFLVPEPKGGARDDKNPDKALRSRKLLGLQIFWNLAPAKARFKGKGYSPEDGRNFNAEVWREGNVLKVKGCVTVICRTVTFTRA